MWQSKSKRGRLDGLERRLSASAAACPGAKNMSSTTIGLGQKLDCRKWGCNKWGLRGVWPPPGKIGQIGLFRPFSAFFALFRRVQRAPGKSRERRKKAFFLRYPQTCLEPHHLNPHLLHSKENYCIIKSDPILDVNDYITFSKLNSKQLMYYIRGVPTESNHWARNQAYAALNYIAEN